MIRFIQAELLIFVFIPDVSNLNRRNIYAIQLKYHFQNKEIHGSKSPVSVMPGSKSDIMRSVLIVK